jgi:hypothetical protein
MSSCSWSLRCVWSAVPAHQLIRSPCSDCSPAQPRLVWEVRMMIERTARVWEVSPEDVACTGSVFVKGGRLHARNQSPVSLATGVTAAEEVKHA